MKIIAVSGYKDSGKSTLCRSLLSKFAAIGVEAGYIKRTQEFVCSPENTDSGAAVASGFPALLWGENSFRYETLCEHSDEISAYEAAAKFFPQSDLVILEGGKNLRLPKIWVLKEDETPPDDAGIFAFYDRHGAGDGARRYGAADFERLVSDILKIIDNEKKSARVYLGDNELPMKDFVADFVAGGVRGMLGSLKKPEGMDDTKDIRVYIKNKWQR